MPGRRTILPAGSGLGMYACLVCTGLLLAVCGTRLDHSKAVISVAVRFLKM